MMGDTGWKWWAGTNDEVMTYGPHDTREDAIREAQEDRIGEFQEDDGTWKIGCHVVEARQDPLRLADWIDTDRLLERAEESLADSDRVGCDGDEGPWFACTPEQDRDLAERIKRACDEWQAQHGLVFTCRTFSASRNAEYVVVPHLGDE
ncbi:hypothetical protein [Afipia felis]|uniref:Uncharacterized protein n=2 Tax=Afipia felis TaxID=1035 RepID=A0A380WAX1_AFIFE|nr:hypothetical protein [Afipia felis]EKS29279.1 hypothetical protein HMPREF9697_01807 [Afipia felis ATCC 53690]SUU77987.1 Uncharacterised protein [Afipia felis]SUU86052.1 Uncharacterised protein [Afipia felis]